MNGHPLVTVSVLVCTKAAGKSKSRFNRRSLHIRSVVRVIEQDVQSVKRESEGFKQEWFKDKSGPSVVLGIGQCLTSQSEDGTPRVLGKVRHQV